MRSFTEKRLGSRRPEYDSFIWLGQDLTYPRFLARAAKTCLELLVGVREENVYL